MEFRGTRTMLVVILTVLLAGPAHCRVKPITTLPTDLSVRQGEDIQLPCILQQPGFCDVYWYRKDLQTYFSRNGGLMPRIPADVSDRYAIVGNASAGDFTLRITNVTKWDDGEYQCACYARAHRDSFTSEPARLQVLVAPPSDFPKCEIRKKHTPLLPGDEVEFVCTSSGGSPPVQLQWFNGEQELQSDIVWDQQTTAKHKVVVPPGDNLSKYYCQATGTALISPRNCSVGPVLVSRPPLIHMESNLQKLWEGSDTQPLVGGSPQSHDMIELSFSCGASVNYTRDINNFTWYINNKSIRPEMLGFTLENNGRTLRVTDISLLYSTTYVEIVCQLSINGLVVSNSSTVVSLNDPVKPTTGRSTELVQTQAKTLLPIQPDESDVFVHKHPRKWRMWPIWLLIICVLMFLLLLILLAVYSPAICGCKKRKRGHQSHCHHTTTKAGTQISEFHYTHSQGCGTLRTSRDTLNVYEHPEYERAVSEQQRQQVQATLHVVVHSANNSSSNNQMMDSPVISTAETVVSSNYGPTENCLAKTTSHAVGNYYHPGDDHYQKVRPGVRPAPLGMATMVSSSVPSSPIMPSPPPRSLIPPSSAPLPRAVIPSPKPHPPVRRDSLEPHYQRPRQHVCCSNQTWGHNMRRQQPDCNLPPDSCLPPAIRSSQPDITESCYVRTLPYPPNEIKQARLVIVDGGPHEFMDSGNMYLDHSVSECDNIYENIPGEDGDIANKHTLV